VDLLGTSLFVELAGRIVRHRQAIDAVLEHLEGTVMPTFVRAPA
jgi:hypothetical protein